MVRAAEPQELDVQALLRLFLRKVDTGAPAGYATFRECWQQMQFSFVYEGCKERVFSQDFIAWLLAAACDHLWTPLPGDAQGVDETDGHRDSSGTAPQPAQHPSQGAMPPSCPVLPEPKLLMPTPHVTVDGSHAEGFVHHTQLGHSEQEWATQSFPELHAAAAADTAPGQPNETHLVGHGHLGQMLLAEEAAHPEQQDAAAARLAPGHLNESSLLAMLMENDDMHLLEPDRNILEALSPADMPAKGPIQLHDAAARERPSFALQAGALYTIYTIHKTQPAYKGMRVRAYIPVTSLQAISDLLLEARRRQVPDIPAIIKCLVQEDAFVCGGVRRPPAGRQVIRDGPARMAQVDMSERSAMQPMTMRHLAKTQLALRELKHVQLLCDSYNKAQHSVFAAADSADMPPSIADLSMGERFKELARQITLDVHKVLAGNGTRESKRKKRADQKAPQADAAAAEEPDSEGRVVRRRTVRKIQPEVQAELSGLDLGGLPQSAKEVELRRAQEHAEIRARQRLWAERGACALAAAEDMPDELGHGGRQPEAASGQLREDDRVARQRTSRVIADVFGDDSEGDSSYGGSGRDEQSREAAPQVLVQPAKAPIHEPATGNDNVHSNSGDSPGEVLGIGKAGLALGKAMKGTTEKVQRYSTREAKAQGAGKSSKTPAASKGKQRPVETVLAGEAARPAKRKGHGQAAAKCAEEAYPDEQPVGTSRKNAESTQDMRRPSTRQQKRTRVQSDAVDWKAYADALDVRLAEAEALLANDDD